MEKEKGHWVDVVLEMLKKKSLSVFRSIEDEISSNLGRGEIHKDDIQPPLPRNANNNNKKHNK